jgi:transcriptional regulator with XRE-family HTH domain
MNDLSQRTKYLREIRSWTLEELGRNLGVTLNTVQWWEMGKTKTPLWQWENFKADSDSTCLPGWIG